MTNNKNNLPIYAEEQIINEEQLSIQEILAQFRQLVPVNFVKLETKGKNYMCSTQGWKEPVCERYMFFDKDNKPVQLDIPQELMVELGLSENEDKNINYPIYISPEVLKRTPIQLGTTIKNKGEIFIQKPLTIQNLEPELTKWLTELKNSREKISQLTITEKLSQELTQEIQLLKTELQGEKQLSQAQQENQKNKIKLLQDKIKELEEEKEHLRNDCQNRLQQELNQKDNEINRLKGKIREIERERDNRPTQQQLDNIHEELEKEKGWWDKWFNDSDDKPIVKGSWKYPFYWNNEPLNDFLERNWTERQYYDSGLNYASTKKKIKEDLIISLPGFGETYYIHTSPSFDKPHDLKRLKKLIRLYYEYYRNK